LDTDPDQPIMLDPDLDEMNADPHPDVKTPFSMFFDYLDRPTGQRQELVAL
jgi:hypothetical protein